MNSGASFPSISTLRNGIIRATIAHAIWSVRYPAFVHERSWESCNYNLQNSEGGRGTMTFVGTKVVAAFFSPDSFRKMHLNKQPYSLEKYTAKMPVELAKIANEQTFQYLLDQYDEQTIPLVTALLWGEGQTLTSFCSWTETWANGANLAFSEFLDEQEGLKVLEENYNFTDQQMNVIRNVSRRRFDADELPIRVTPQEKQIIMAFGQAGIKDTSELLLAIDILW